MFIYLTNLLTSKDKSSLQRDE